MHTLLIVGTFISTIGIVMLATYISQHDNLQPQTLTVSLVLVSTGILFIGLYLCSGEKCRNRCSSNREYLIIEHYDLAYT